jgi:hypothetical protein
MSNKMSTRPSIYVKDGNIIPYEVLNAILFHPLTNYLFSGKPTKWLPIGLVNGTFNNADVTYALFVDTSTIRRKLPELPVIASKLVQINAKVVEQFQMLLPATKFGETLPAPYELNQVSEMESLSGGKLWEILGQLVDYIACICFNLSPGHNV